MRDWKRSSMQESRWRWGVEGGQQRSGGQREEKLFGMGANERFARWKWKGIDAVSGKEDVSESQRPRLTGRPRQAERTRLGRDDGRGGMPRV